MRDRYWIDANGSFLSQEGAPESQLDNELSVEEFETLIGNARNARTVEVDKRRAARHAQLVRDLEAGNFGAVASALTGYKPDTGMAGEESGS